MVKKLTPNVASFGGPSDLIPELELVDETLNSVGDVTSYITDDMASQILECAERGFTTAAECRAFLLSQAAALVNSSQGNLDRARQYLIDELGISYGQAQQWIALIPGFVVPNAPMPGQPGRDLALPFQPGQQPMPGGGPQGGGGFIPPVSQGQQPGLIVPVQGGGGFIPQPGPGGAGGGFVPSMPGRGGLIPGEPVRPSGGNLEVPVVTTSTVPGGGPDFPGRPQIPVPEQTNLLTGGGPTNKITPGIVTPGNLIPPFSGGTPGQAMPGSSPNDGQGNVSVRQPVGANPQTAGGNAPGNQQGGRRPNQGGGNQLRTPGGPARRDRPSNVPSGTACPQCGCNVEVKIDARMIASLMQQQGFAVSALGIGKAESISIGGGGGEIPQAIQQAIREGARLTGEERITIHSDDSWEIDLRIADYPELWHLVPMMVRVVETTYADSEDNLLVGDEGVDDNRDVVDSWG